MHSKIIYPHEVNGEILGKIGIVLNPLTGQSVDMVYQRVARGLGNIRNLGVRDLQLRTEPPRQDAQSEPQLQLRRRFTAAIQAYQTLDTATKAGYKTRARRKNRTGYNLFIAEFCQQHPAEEFQEDRIKLEFYGDAEEIQRPFTVLKFYIMAR